MTTPKMINSAVDTFSPSEFEGTLAELAIRVKDLIVEHGPTAKLDFDSEYYEPYDTTPRPRYSVIVCRPETDHEMKNRIAQEQAYNEARLERDRKEFERLSAQFNRK